LGAVVIGVARKIGLPDVVNVGLAALCIGGEQESHRLASHCIERRSLATDMADAIFTHPLVAEGLNTLFAMFDG
jgi:hypothetical protein